jgi:PKD repeat protein
MSLTAQQLSRLRGKHPHKVKLYMTAITPVEIYTGHVTGLYVPERGARVITVSDLSGSITDARPGNTIEVYDIASGAIVSKRRLRSIDNHTLTLDENNIVWSLDMGLRIYRYWELWPIYPWIDDSDAYTFYKDRDIAYLDQTLYPPPVAIAGCPKVGMLRSTQLSMALNALASYTIAHGATITGYYWECTGGTITNPNIAQTLITFTEPGLYWLSLTVTDSNDKTRTTRRPIRIHEPTGTHAPILDFELESKPAGSWNDGGWQASIQLHGANASTSVIPDNSMIILWTEETFDGDTYYMDACGNIKFAGYIRSDKSSRDDANNTASLSLVTVDGILDSFYMYSMSVEEVADDPTTWYQYKEPLTVSGVLHYFWQWHSTLMDIADVFLPTDNTLRLPACDDLETGTLYSMPDNFARQYGIFAHVCCNKGGQVYVTEDYNTLSDARRIDSLALFEMEDTDRRLDSGVEFSRNEDNDTASITVSGVYWDDATDKYLPIMSLAPGTLPDAVGSSHASVERQVLESQEQLNFISGRLYAILQSTVKEVSLGLAGNYPVDVVPQQFITLNIPGSYFARGVGLVGDYLIRTVDSGLDMSAGLALPTIGLEPVIEDSVDGVTVIVPEIPDNTTNPTYPPVLPPTLPVVPPNPFKPPSILPPKIPGDGWVDNIVTVWPNECSLAINPGYNGPFSHGGFDIFSESAYGSTQITVPCEVVLRKSSVLDGQWTYIIIDGCFYERLSSVWEPTQTVDWIRVYGQRNGVNVATGTVTLYTDNNGCGYRVVRFLNLAEAQVIDALVFQAVARPGYEFTDGAVLADFALNVNYYNPYMVIDNLVPGSVYKVESYSGYWTALPGCSGPQYLYFAITDGVSTGPLGVEIIGGAVWSDFLLAFGDSDGTTSYSWCYVKPVTDKLYMKAPDSNNSDNCGFDYMIRISGATRAGVTRMTVHGIYIYNICDK